ARARDGTLHRTARRERPEDLSGVLVERVDLAAPVADVDALVVDERGALGRTDARSPADLPETDAERDHLAVEPVPSARVARRPVHERLEDDVLVDRRRRRDAAPRVKPPCTLAGARVDRGKISRVGCEVEAA